MNSKNKKLLSKINNEKRHSSIEKIKRKRRRELIAIVSLFFMFITVGAFMFSPYVKLKNIEVHGYSQITEEEILSAGNINTNVKTWTIKDDEIENNIKNKYSIFKNVKVKSKMLSSITINVEEYKLIAQKKLDDGSYQIIMENGQPYNGQIRNNFNLPILEKFENNSKLEEVYKNLAHLKYEVLLQISEINNSENSEIIIYMKDGQKVKAVSSTFAEKLNYYDEISKYIKDKNKTTLNLINGAYLETAKTEKRRNENIKQLLSRQGLKDDSTSKTDKEKVDDTEKVEKNNKAENSTTNSKVVSSTNNKNTKQQSVTNNKNE